MNKLTWSQAHDAGLATARGFAALGIPSGTIRRWAHENRLQAHGKAPGGAHLYSLREVSEVAEKMNHLPKREVTCK